MSTTELVNISETGKNTCLILKFMISQTFRASNCSLMGKMIQPLNFTFSIPCIIIQLSQFEPTNARKFIKATILLQHIHPVEIL